MYIFMDVHLALQAAANLQVLLFPSRLKAPLPWKQVKVRGQTYCLSLCIALLCLKKVLAQILTT